MLILVTGGSGSGKSEYAEGIAVSLAEREGLPLYYIAAMKPYGEEGKRRVERHRRLRAGKGFQTVERCGSERSGAAGRGSCSPGVSV